MKIKEKKINIGIITINDNNNYGNRLQNYAVQQTLKKLNVNTLTIRNSKLSKFQEIKRILKKAIRLVIRKNDRIRTFRFKEFNKHIKLSKKKYYTTSNFKNIEQINDYIIVGSDQVWNPEFNRMSNIDLLTFANDRKKIAFSASLGIEKLQGTSAEKLKKELIKFKSISVREDKAKEIIENLTRRKDIEVLIDPTMLLTPQEWDKLSKQPKQLKKGRFILNYFLGNLSEARKKQIEKIANENDCEIINILDKHDPFYMTGPSEFLYLEKNAFLICTDSFHSSIFAILYNRPFVVFEREDNKANMNSRLETLLSKFKLEDRKFNNKEITKENLEHNYTEAYKILEKERKKSKEFLKKALDIE